MADNVLPPRRMEDIFRNLARRTADVTGSPWGFVGGAAIVLIWAALGPVFDYSDTWQLIINTGTTIATFLIVFLIQNTQNRDSRVVQLKLDELIRALGPARTELVDMESMTDKQLDALKKDFEGLHAHAAQNLQKIALHKSAKATRKESKNHAT